MSEMNSLISVIVPVYNVEKYIDECLESILKQSYSNLEIIIVNDGSTDNSLSKCEKYSDDKRIIIINKENGGLSSARNEGLKHATGKYILFVDSDDYYISDKAVEILYELLVSNNADIACCGWTSNIKQNKRKIETVNYDSKQAISRLLDVGGFKCFAWNKIYKKNLFDNILFPEGELFEDIKTQFNLLRKCNNIVYSNQPLYFYRQRKDSINNSSFSDRNYDLINAIDYVINNVRNESKIERRLNVGYAYYFLAFVNKAIIAGVDIRELEERLRRHIKKNKYNILKSDSVDFKRKCMLVMYAYTTNIYRKIYVNFALK